MQRNEALKKAIALCGGQIAFAAALTRALKNRGISRTISQQIVSYWANAKHGLPSIYCVDVEELPAVNFNVTKHDLRPDVFGYTPYTPIEESI